jgi:hypothetical protein
MKNYNTKKGTNLIGYVGENINSVDEVMVQNIVR